MKIRRGEFVHCEGSNCCGMVKRVAKDGSWADVDWGSWVKRMRTSWLIKPAEIPVPNWSSDEIEVTLLQFDT